MKDVLFALIFMALGAGITHVSWLHSWHMYRSGKQEGQCLCARGENRRAAK